MCGIAGILFKKPDSNHVLGRTLVDMLDGCQHRGIDSTGFALYEDGISGLRLRFLLPETGDAAPTIAKIKSVLAEFDAKVLEEETAGCTYRITVDFKGDIRPFAYAMEHAAKLISLGSSLDVIKDVGTSHELDALYHVGAITGSHGIGHVRLATESEVKPESAHPFWATGFSDIAIVHNGQITNYWKMRRRLERRGFDRLAAKPMVMYEDDTLVAIASEEVSLNRLVPGQPLNTTEPAPGTCQTWSRSI